MDAALQQQLCIDAGRAVCGGCIHRCYEVRIGGARRFLKTNGAEYADAFAAEADGLRALRDAGLRAPEPLACGVVGSHAYLLLEFLELTGAGDFAALGRTLANAHRNAGPRFGWARDNYIGLTPQSLSAAGGYRVYGKTCEEFESILEDALALEAAGASFVLLEAIPEEPARYVRDALKVPVYGIGAGRHVDGQLLILHDMIGAFVGDVAPKFAKRYANVGKVITDALTEFNRDIKEGRFPADEHLYPIDAQEAAKIRAYVERRRN